MSINYGLTNVTMLYLRRYTLFYIGTTQQIATTTAIITIVTKLKCKRHAYVGFEYDIVQKTNSE